MEFQNVATLRVNSMDCCAGLLQCCLLEVLCVVASKNTKS